MARLRGATLCDSCAREAVTRGQQTMREARTLHPEHAWGHHYELPHVTDRQMRQLVERIARALPRAATASTDGEQRAAIHSVWPDLMECAAKMNGTPTERCHHYILPADAMSSAKRILLEEAGEEEGAVLFLAYWRVWWTAASQLGRPVQAEAIADDSLPQPNAEQALDRLVGMAYVANFGHAELAGTSFAPGYSAFIDCKGCQEWRVQWRSSLL